MNTGSKKLFVGAAALAATAALAPSAWAGCGESASKLPASWTTQANTANPLLTLVTLGQPSIVGMWAIKFIGTGASAGYSDFGYAQWHSDGTEFTNSGGLPPAGQNYCLGVWAQTGPFTYKLNHFAFAYTPNGEARVNIKEMVTTNVTGQTFQGTFTIDFYNVVTGAPLGPPNFPPHTAGNIMGTRVNP
jgi:hypothetical protein